MTGGASGLGAEVVRQLARAGARVTILDINLDLAQTLAQEVGAHAVACDITSSDSVQQALQSASTVHGPARILINCAGIGGARRLVGKDGQAMPLDDFSRIINVNLIGTFNMIRLTAAGMIAQEAMADGERGVIINTASVAAFDGQVGQAAYAASKGAIASLTLPAARELARFGIRVMTIAPGIFETPMMAGMTPEVRDSLAAGVPFPPRLGKPSEYAALVRHIIENSMLNGEVIRLDGALRMAAK